VGTFEEVERFYAEGKEGFDGMKLEASRGCLYRRVQLAPRVKIQP
jgi:hypothetical protein